MPTKKEASSDAGSGSGSGSDSGSGSGSDDNSGSDSSFEPGSKLEKDLTLSEEEADLEALRKEALGELQEGKYRCSNVLFIPSVHNFQMVAYKNFENY